MGKIRLEKLKLDKTLPKGYLSVTQIEMYLRCPMQYYYRYVNDLKLPPAVSLIEGSSHHESLALNNLTYYKTKENLELSIVQECFSDTFSDQSKIINKREWKLSGETKDSVISRGKKIINNYMKKIAPKIKPNHKPEQKFEIKIGEVPVLGFIDVESKNRILDYKIVKNMKSRKDVENDIQLTVYSKARNKENVGFCCLTKGVSSNVAIIESTRNNGDYFAIEQLIRSVVSSIRKGAFPMCNPNNTFPCSERWCGYWKICRGKYLKGVRIK